PVLLLPLLLVLRQPVLFAVVAAQAIQLPVALASSAVHLVAGRLDLPLAGLCGALLLAGSLFGQRAAGGLDQRQLQRMVSWLLLAVGAWFLWLLWPH
ncbi:MAG: sulfite exporter TauE/SafE family protein, partial [Comamonadaceae bacterium]